MSAVPTTERLSLDQHGSEDDISVLRLVNALLRHRRLVAVVPAALFTLVVGIGLIADRTYSTRVSFTPTVQSMPLGQLGGLAAQFGVTLPGQDPTQSPDFYADLINTPEFLKKVALTQYAFVADGDTVRGNLIKLLEIDKDTPAEALDETIKQLSSGVIAVDPNRETFVVGVVVQTNWAALSQQVATRIFELVNEFNVGNRRYQASQEYKFMESRVETSRDELRSAENDLQSFLQRNREFKSDPQLSFQYDRLQRNVTMRQEVFTTLTQAAEQARLESARNTPSITLVEQPAPALRADRRHLLTKGILAIMGGLMLAVFVAFSREFLGGSSGAQPTEVEAFRRLRADAIRDLRRVAGPARRFLPSE